MADPSFDDLLDSLDQIQAERQPSHHHHEHHHNDHHHNDHHHKPAVDIEYHIEPVSHRSPISPPRQGDLKQYERQATVAHHSPHVGHHSPSSGGSGGVDPRCAKCGGTLYGTEYVTAAGKSYHQEHFACVKCNNKLMGSYFDHHNQTYCPNCAGELLPCTKCRRGITGQYLVQEGKCFHNECVDKKHCAKCNRQIEDTVLTALGKTWHQRCFTCITCHKELGTQFVTKDGQGQCENCSTKARPHCEKCHQPLSGEYINFEGKSYHQDCFVCSQCRNKLGTSGFYSVNGQVQCKPGGCRATHY